MPRFFVPPAALEGDFVTLTGDVGAVREAVAAASRDAELLVGTSVIPRPAQQVFQSLL